MKNFFLAGCAFAAFVPLSACTPTKTNHGNILQDYQLAEVAIGKDTRSDVLQKLGSPTTQAPFDDTVWYYMGQETEKRGILDPEVINERIVLVDFNDSGIVEKIEEIDNGRLDLPYVRRKTKTSGNDISVMEQFLGNLGRFNVPAPE